MKILLLVVVLFFDLAMLSWWQNLKRKPVTHAKPPAAGTIPPNSIFHKPHGASCPPGTKLMPNYFSERDGSTHDACYNPKGDGSIDYLNPGEGCGVGLVIEVPQPERPRT